MKKQPFRVEGLGDIERNRPIMFTFNGKTYTGFKGDTLASALLANGVILVGRSFKYHRPRGIFGVGVDDPNALVQIGVHGRSTPNERATTTEIFEGLIAKSVNVWPSLRYDILAINNSFSSMLPAGFYYKTFMWPASFWPIYEYFIRKAAGLGTVPKFEDPDTYEKKYVHCDLLIVGGGIAGLVAAHVSAKAGTRVILADERANLGGSKFNSEVTINNKPVKKWVSDIESELESIGDCMVLKRTTAVIHSDHNFVVLREKIIKPNNHSSHTMISQRLWKVRAKSVIYATGALERPMVFQNNDLPGVMLGSAVTDLIHRYGVCPGKNVAIAGNNASIYTLAEDLKACGANIVALSDSRKKSDNNENLAFDSEFPVFMGQAPICAFGKKKIRSVSFGPVNIDTAISQNKDDKKIDCDLLCLSGGYDPNLNLIAQAGGSVSFDTEVSSFNCQSIPKDIFLIGAAAGNFDLQDTISKSLNIVKKIIKQNGTSVFPDIVYQTKGSKSLNAVSPVWYVQSKKSNNKQFVDLHNDVTVSDIDLSVREGYKSIEHFKRYTTSGMGPDQGKIANVNALGILSKKIDINPQSIGTTRFRPPYTPITFGALAGRDLGDLAEPIRITALNVWHQESKAVFENVGQWKRPWYYPKNEETMEAAVNRECKAVRKSVGIFDASTLGKIELVGPDAGELLNRIYINRFDDLKVGSCRYGIICGDDGMVIDDGVTSRLEDKRWLMTTTTGNASKVFHWIDEWLQCEWPELDVFLTSVSSHWSTITIAGSNARNVLLELAGDVDVSNSSFPHHTWKIIKIFGVVARVFRVSFTGELSYEINIPSRYAHSLWESIISIGERYDITPFGTESLHTLRAEKGYIVVGHETDGSVTPDDIGFGWMMRKRKDFIGHRSLSRESIIGEKRPQLVGLLPETYIPEGAQVLSDEISGSDKQSIGHVTSSYNSPSLGIPIALGLIQGGRSLIGSNIRIIGPSNSMSVNAKIVSHCFYDPNGDRLNV